MYHEYAEVNSKPLKMLYSTIILNSIFLKSQATYIYPNRSILLTLLLHFKKIALFFFGHGAKTKKKKPNPWAMTELRVHSVTTARCSNTTPPHLSVNFHSNPNDCYPQFASRCLILSTNNKSNRPPYHTIHNPKMKIKTNQYQ